MTSEHCLITHASQIVQEIRAGLEGVTPGEWKAAKPADAPSLVRAVYYHNGLRHTAFIALCDCGGQNNEANAAHLARCSPDRIATLLNAFDAQAREIAELREAFGGIVEADEKRRNTIALNAALIAAEDDWHAATNTFLERARSALRAKEKSNG
jgi:hypothetical protein